MAGFKIIYDHEEETAMLVLPDGRKSDPMDLPETGIGLATVGDEMFAVVTPDHDGEGNHLEHDTVYRLVKQTTEVEGDFPISDEVDYIVDDENADEEDDEG